VQLLLVHAHVTMAHELARLIARGAEAQAIDDVVEPSLELAEQQLAHDALLARRTIEGQAELALLHAVQALHLLLLAQLQAVALELALHTRRLPVLAGGIVALLDGALLR